MKYYNNRFIAAFKLFIWGLQWSLCPTCSKRAGVLTNAQAFFVNAMGGRCFKCVMKDNATSGIHPTN